jgi:hypothetical protein
MKFNKGIKLYRCQSLNLKSYVEYGTVNTIPVGMHIFVRSCAFCRAIVKFEKKNTAQYIENMAFVCICAIHSSQFRDNLEVLGDRQPMKLSDLFSSVNLVCAL